MPNHQPVETVKVERLIIQSIGKDGEPISAWTTIGTFWASVEHLAQAEITKGEVGSQATGTVRVTLLGPELALEDRLTWRDTEYRVSTVIQRPLGTPGRVVEADLWQS